MSYKNNIEKILADKELLKRELKKWSMIKKWLYIITPILVIVYLLMTIGNFASGNALYGILCFAVVILCLSILVYSRMVVSTLRQYYSKNYKDE